MVHSTVLFHSMFSDLDLPFENELFEDESSGDEDPPLLDLNEQGPQDRAIKIPLSFNMLTFNNEIEKDKEVPEKCCTVCCKLLYPEDYCPLSLKTFSSFEREENML